MNRIKSVLVTSNDNHADYLKQGYNQPAFKVNKQLNINKHEQKSIKTDNKQSNDQINLDRPVSFTCNQFDVLDQNKECQSTGYNQNNEIKDVQRLQAYPRSAFVSFAVINQDQIFSTSKQQIPYFGNNQQNQQFVKSNSYTSNFMFEDSKQPITWHKDIIQIKNQQFSNKKEEQDQKNQISKNMHKGKIMESDGLMKIQKNKYKKISFKISQITLSIQQIPILIKNISKLKIYPADEELPKFYVIKLTTKQMGEQLLIGLKKNVQYNQFPLPYYTFAKLIIKKLKISGISSTTQWQPPFHPANAFYYKKQPSKNQQNDNSSLAQAQISKQNKNNKKRRRSKSTKHIDVQEKQSRSRSRSYEKQGDNHKAVTYIHGKIYKKSKYWGSWQKRYIIVNQLGIFSYRNSQEAEASIKIQRKTIKQIWTWFGILTQQKKQIKKNIKKNISQEEEQFITHEFQQRQIINKICSETQDKVSNKYLIIKLKHGFNQHTQFAIPIYNFDLCSKKNWLHAFYKVLPVMNKDNKKK